MTRYQLAKLVEWAGKLIPASVCRKSCFCFRLLAAHSVPNTRCTVTGPYSQEAARCSDEMVQAGLLKEQSQENRLGCNIPTISRHMPRRR